MDIVLSLSVSGDGEWNEISADMLRLLSSPWVSLAVADITDAVVSSCSIISSSVLAAAPPVKQHHKEVM